MRKLRKNPIVLFAAALLLALSGLFSPEALAEQKANQAWKLEFTGQPLFDTMVQKDGSLLYGNYNIVNGVYHADIMTIDSKGKKTKAWSVKEERVEIGGTPSNPQILAVNYSKGTVTSYTPSGKKMWTYNLKQKITYMTPDNGYLRLFAKDKIYTITPNGKLLSIFPDLQGYTQFSQDGSMYVFNGKDVIKYTNKGKLAWKRSLPMNDPRIQWISDFQIVKVTENHIYVSAEYSGYNQEENNNEEFSITKLYSIDKYGKTQWALDNIGSVWELTEYKNNTLFVTPLYFYQVEPNGNIRTKFEMIKGSSAGQATSYIQNEAFTSNGELLVNTESFLAKITPNGAYSWKTTIPRSDYYNFYYMNGLISLIDFTNGRLQLYSDSGKSLSNYSFTEGGYIRLSGVNAKLKTVYVTQSIYIEKSKKYRTILYALKY